jgi:hypothetical protein
MSVPLLALAIVGWVKRSADPTPFRGGHLPCVGSSLTLDPTYTGTPS